MVLIIHNAPGSDPSDAALKIICREMLFLSDSIKIQKCLQTASHSDCYVY